MAIVNLYTQVHEDTYQNIGNPYTDAEKVTVSGTQVTILWDSTDNYKTVFTGGFQLSGNPDDPVSGGTITGLKEFENGQLLWEASGLSLDVDYYLLYAQRNDAKSLFYLVLGGDDKIWADDTPDILIGFAGNDFIDGNGGDDVIDGLGGNDVLYGASGNDMLWGASGDDRLYGEWGRDGLIGEDGNDKLFGGDGADTLEGDAGRDILNGGQGADLMYGGAGNDTYYVDHADDVVDEMQEYSLNDAGGIDKVISKVDFELGMYQENLILNGTALQGVGNELKNTIKGNAENNLLKGLAGNDVLKGMNGNDALYGGSGSDKLLGGNGKDKLIGDGGKDELKGGGGNDILKGGSGNDVLIGQLGRDVLVGGKQDDIFVFNSIKESRVGSGHDIIKDFQLGDKIKLSGIDFSASKSSNNAVSYFETGTEFTGFSAEASLFYDTDDQMLYGNVDGDAEADFAIEIRLVGKDNLELSDFIV